MSIVPACCVAALLLAVDTSLPRNLARADTVDHSVEMLYQIFPDGHSMEKEGKAEGATHLEISESRQDANTTNAVRGHVRLQTASIGLRAEAGGGAPADGLALIGAGLNDTIYFELPDGVDSVVIPYSVSVTGTLNNARFGAKQGQVRASLGPAGSEDAGILNGTWVQESTDLDQLFGSTFSNRYTVQRNTPVSVTMSFYLRVTPGTEQSVIADALSTAEFSWVLPEGVRFTSASQQFLVPLPPSALLLLGGLIGLLGVWRRPH